MRFRGSLLRGCWLLGMATQGLGCGPASRGDRAWQSGNDRAAIEAYGQATSLDDGQRQRYARALARNDDLPRALGLMEAIRSEALTPDGLMVMGYSALESGDPAAAASFFLNARTPSWTSG